MKKARYDGAHEAVVVTWPPGAAYPEQTWLVQRGHQLPQDAPAPLRDELLAGPDWNEVEQPTAKTDKKGDS
jgi:hypothetical protein